ncbi:MAG: PD-(D/E)XK nuclease family protein [Solirubrobacteraceae bacterium]
METAGGPAHRIVTGPVAAIEPALVEHAFAAKRGDPLRPVVILVGETLLRPYLRRRLAELGGPHLNIHVVTVAELGLRLGERAMISERRLPLPVLADRILAHEAAQASPGYFDAVSGTLGFGQVLHRTLGDLQRAEISAERLSEVADRLPEREKVTALAAMAARHAKLRADHYDAEDALAAADPERLGADQLLVYGLWEAPEILRRAIAGIGERRPVTAYFPTAHPAADRAHAGLRGWLSETLGAQSDHLPAPGDGRSALGHLHSSLGSRRPQPAPSPDDGSVRVVSAPDPSREVASALRACLAWAREGIAFHEMAIAYRHADPYRALVAAIAREATLPIYDNVGTPLAELPVGRRTLALLDLLENDLDRASVIAFATDSAMPEATRARYRGSPAQWDSRSREAGVVRGRGEWALRLDALRERLKERLGGDDDNPPAHWLDERLRQIEGLKTFVEDLADRIAGRPGEAPWSEHVAHLEEMLNTYLTGHEAILDSVRALTRLDGLTPRVAAERFIAVVRGVVGGLRSTDVEEGSAGAFRARGINVIDVNSLRHTRFRAVCVLGLAERSFPPPPRQDPLLLDDERERIGLPLRARGPDPEPLQFALAVQAAEERLLLSYPRTEYGSGRPLIASSFLRSAAEALAGERIPAESLPDRDDSWLQRLGADRVAAPALADALNLSDYDRTLIETEQEVGVGLMAEKRPTAARGRRAWLARQADGLLTPYEGGLTEAVREALAGHPRLTEPMSPSSLETFATCAMRFFLSRMLGLSELDEPEQIAQLTALERGSLMHEVMERAMRTWLPHDPPSETRRDDHLAELERIAGRVFAAYEARGVTGYQALWEADREAILLDLRLWYEREVVDSHTGRFDAADFEVGFGLSGGNGGSHSTERPLELPVGGRRLGFHGRIDRLEWRREGGGFRVIDYKTGRFRERRKDVFAGGTALQLPLYLHAAADVILGRDWREGRSEYFYSTRKGGFTRVEMTADKLGAHREEFERLLRGFAQAMREGTFVARPSDDNCRFCDFRTLCPSVNDHRAQRDRKSADPRVRALDELAEIE